MRCAFNEEPELIDFLTRQRQELNCEAQPDAIVAFQRMYMASPIGTTRQPVRQAALSLRLRARAPFSPRIQAVTGSLVRYVRLRSGTNEPYPGEIVEAHRFPNTEALAGGHGWQAGRSKSSSPSNK